MNSKTPINGHQHGRVPKEIRQKQLVKVAEKLFAEYGYAETSIEAIAQSAGVTRPMVYNYFGSKEGIYMACQQWAREQLEQALLGAAGNSDNLENRIHQIADAYFSFVANNPNTWNILYGGGVAVAGNIAQLASDLRFATVSKLAALMRADAPTHISDQELTLIAHGISGAGEQIAKWWKANPDVPQATVVNTHVKLIWSGIEQIQQSTH